MLRGAFGIFPRLRFFTIVQPKTAVIIERLGKYHLTLNPGFHFLLPLFDLKTKEMTLKEKNINVTNQSVITKDNVEIKLDSVLYCKITDAKTAHYQTTDAYLYTKEMAKSLLRTEIGKLTLDSTLHEREKLNKKLLEDMKIATDRWGVEIKRYEIKTIYLDDDFVKLMNLEADSERYKRGKMLNAEAFKISSVNDAERDKEKIINQETANGQSSNLHFKALAEKVNILKEMIETKKITKENLEFKLKEDMIDAIGGLSDDQKMIIMKKDITDLSSFFESMEKQLKIKKEN